MKITREFILNNRTERGMWNKAQLEIIGVTWPPLGEWINRSVGKEISDEDAKKFIELAKKPQKSLF